MDKKEKMKIIVPFVLLAIIVPIIIPIVITTSIAIIIASITVIKEHIFSLFVNIL